MSKVGTLYLVSTPIGNLGDLTHRAAEVLRAADLLLVEDTRRTRVLLDHYGIADRTLKSFHRHNEASRCEEAKLALLDGSALALVSDSGTPLISDPGLRLVRVALEVGASVVPIPGPSAALAALVGSGLEPQPFTFVGFPPRVGRGREDLMALLSSLKHTAIVYESPHRLTATLEELAERLGSDRQAAVARELTKLHEEFVRGTLSELAAYYRAQPPRGECVICVGGTTDAVYAGLEEEGRALAARLIEEGASTRDVTRALRERFGLERNRAYELALDVARAMEETESL